MALNDKKISTAPGTKPDTRHQTTYSASRGGHYPAPATPVPGTPKGGKR